MLYNLASADECLYQYRSAETLVKHILPTGSLRMGPFALTNDPRETKDWVFGYGTRNGPLDIEEVKRVEREITQTAKSKSKVICFVRDGTGGVGMEPNAIYERGFCRPRMWAQYAQNHTGACLVFQSNSLRRALTDSISNPADLFEGDVAYRDRSRGPSLQNNPFIIDLDAIRQHGVREAARAHVHQYWRDLFFEKMKDWSDEREHRWVLWEADSDFHHFRFRDSLVGIVLGPDFPSEFLDPVFTFSEQYKSSEVAQILWINGAPQILLLHRPRSSQIFKAQS
jgi:hypothetical protein